MSSNAKTELAKAIEDLYQVFSKYPLTALDGCPYCVTKDDKCLLTVKLLKNLTEDDLGRYSGKAITTWGTVEDFKHFLPRIYELVAEYNSPYEEFVIFNKLKYGEWQNWPEVETQALKAYFRALWKFVLEGEEAYFQDYFIAIASIYTEFEELLFDWEKFESIVAVEILAAEIFRHNEALFSNTYFKGAFFTSIEYSKRFRVWTRSPRVREALLQALEVCQSERIITEIGVAYDLIELDIKFNHFI